MYERTNPWKGEFSPSGLVDFVCPRKFYLKYILGLTPKQSAIPLIFGSCFHAGVEAFYSVPHSAEMEVKQEAACQAFLKTWQEMGNAKGDTKRNLSTGLILMKQYVHTYQNDPDIYEKEDIESGQWFPMPNGTMLRVVMDRIVSDSIGATILVDTKTTTSSLTDYYFRQFENHFPTSLYMHVVRELLGKCDNIQIDAVHVPPYVRGSKYETFARRPFFRTDLQLGDALLTYRDRTNRIMEALQQPKEEQAMYFPCNQEECNKYGECPYMGICKHGLNHPSVRVDFDIEKRGE